MCRNIRTLFNFEPPATEIEIRDASLQFIRKLSGFSVPSKANEEAFERAVDGVGEGKSHAPIMSWRTCHSSGASARPSCDLTACSTSATDTSSPPNNTAAK